MKKGVIIAFLALVSFSFVSAQFANPLPSFKAYQASGGAQVELQDDAVWSDGWISHSGQPWQKFTLQGNSLRQGWLDTRGDATVNLPTSSGTYHIALYSCSDLGNGWDCHGDRWQLVSFTLSNLPQGPNPPPNTGGSASCSQDSDCLNDPNFVCNATVCSDTPYCDTATGTCKCGPGSSCNQSGGSGGPIVGQQMCSYNGQDAIVCGQLDLPHLGTAAQSCSSQGTICSPYGCDSNSGCRTQFTTTTCTLTDCTAAILGPNSNMPGAIGIIMYSSGKVQSGNQVYTALRFSLVGTGADAGCAKTWIYGNTTGSLGPITAPMHLSPLDCGNPGRTTFTGNLTIASQYQGQPNPAQWSLGKGKLILDTNPQPSARIACQNIDGCWEPENWECFKWGEVSLVQGRFCGGRSWYVVPNPSNYNDHDQVQPTAVSGGNVTFTYKNVVRQTLDNGQTQTYQVSGGPYTIGVQSMGAVGNKVLAKLTVEGETTPWMGSYKSYDLSNGETVITQDINP